MYLAEVRVVLETVPWNGDPLNNAYPEAPVRSFAFGLESQGLITYLIVEDMRRVDILKVLWLP